MLTDQCLSLMISHLQGKDLDLGSSCQDGFHNLSDFFSGKRLVIGMGEPWKESRWLESEERGHGQETRVL